MQGLGTTTLITNFQNEHQAADLELEAILKEAKRKGQLAPGDVSPRAAWCPGGTANDRDHRKIDHDRAKAL